MLSSSVMRMALASDTEVVAVIEQLYPRLFRFARFCLERDEAEDAVASALERMWQRRNRYVPARGPLEGWLYAVGANAIRDEARRVRRRPRTVAIDDIQLRDGVSPQQGLGDLRAAISRLSRGDAELIGLRYALDLSNEEISRLVGRSTGATATALHRALRRLRGILQEER